MSEKNQNKNQALYTKYRPQTFKDVLGQEHVTEVLSKALKLGNIAHAYLFSGSRGIGKTSIARILAREIGTTSNDLYEIDAASNTGVDDIRDLNESVNTLPFDSKYKVYILDEVHMLSKSAFNALLKTLEEPPKHVIFILATTEPEKIPDTVISRCETYTFRKPTQKILSKMIYETAKKEGYTLDTASSDLIALLADGSFRDGQGTLQKVIHSSKDTTLSVVEVQKVTGAPKTSLVNGYIMAIAEKDVSAGLSILQEAVDDNIDMELFLQLVVSKVRAVLMLRLDPKQSVSIEDHFSDTDFKILKELAIDKSARINSATLMELLKAYENIGISHVPQLPLELALIELIGQNM